MLPLLVLVLPIALPNGPRSICLRSLYHPIFGASTLNNRLSILMQYSSLVSSLRALKESSLMKEVAVFHVAASVAPHHHVHASSCRIPQLY
jgi:hypothetical protein